jgi:ABC-type uncharacterized transport system permease subunit
MSEIWTQAFMVAVFGGMIRISTPLLFGAMGELVSERSGIMNLGIEGNMLIGAFAAFLTTHASGSLWLGVIAGALAASLSGLLMAFMSSTLKVDQTVTGLAINLLASGVTFYLYRVAFKNAGSANLPSVDTFKVLPIPVLSRIPFIGKVLFTQFELTYIAILLVPVIAFFLYRTRYGLQIRLMGENPRAADMRGINVALHQYLAVIFGAMMAGVGGAFLTLVSGGVFLPNISGGRGFIAFALVIFGNWSPPRILAGALFFGLIDALQLQLQAIGVHVPHQLLLALPYVLTIVVLLGNRRRTRAPLALALPYVREG